MYKILNIFDTPASWQITVKLEVAVLIQSDTNH